MNIHVNLTNIASGLEDGFYTVTIANMEEGVSKSSGNPVVKVAYEIEDSNFKLFDTFSLVDSALWKLRDFVVAAQIPFDENGFDHLTAIGRKLRVEVKNEKYEGKDRPKIVSYIPLS